VIAEWFDTQELGSCVSFVQDFSNEVAGHQFGDPARKVQGWDQETWLAFWFLILGRVNRPASRLWVM
jgi:hypothetical protein